VNLAGGAACPRAAHGTGPKKDHAPRRAARRLRRALRLQEFRSDGSLPLRAMRSRTSAATRRCLRFSCPSSAHNRLCWSNPTGKSAGGANAGADPPFSTILVPAATEIAADPGVECDSWFGGLLNRRRHERNCATDDPPFSTILVPAATGIAADPWASNSYQHQHEAIYFPMEARWLLRGYSGGCAWGHADPRLSSLVPPGRAMSAVFATIRGLK
jgi:hypothetical protein